MTLKELGIALAKLGYQVRLVMNVSVSGLFVNQAITHHDVEIKGHKDNQWRHAAKAHIRDLYLGHERYTFEQDPNYEGRKLQEAIESTWTKE